jgi:signal transduction histidine kinase
MGLQDFMTFAGEIVHELRTPLSVISGNVELALARDRSPAAYREALARIGERVAELIDLTNDFATLAEVNTCLPSPTDIAALDGVFAALCDRFGVRRGRPVTLMCPQPHQRLACDEGLLVSALSLLVEHALRHCRDGSRVRLFALAPDNPSATDAAILWLDAIPTGFTAMAWHALAAGTPAGPSSHGQLRVETAVRMIDACGGSVELAALGGADMCVRIQLRLATARSGATNDIT